MGRHQKSPDCKGTKYSTPKPGVYSFPLPADLNRTGKNINCEDGKCYRNKRKQYIMLLW